MTSRDGFRPPTNIRHMTDRTHLQHLVNLDYSAYGDATPSKPLRLYRHFVRSSQKATALAAATFRESTSWSMGIFTV